MPAARHRPRGRPDRSVACSEGARTNIGRGEGRSQMSLLDKMKSAAQDAATAAKKGAAQVKDKAGDTMLRRKADEAAKQIGYLVYKERTAGESAGGEVDRLVG